MLLSHKQKYTNNTSLNFKDSLRNVVSNLGRRAFLEKESSKKRLVSQHVLPGLNLELPMLNSLPNPLVQLPLSLAFSCCAFMFLPSSIAHTREPTPHPGERCPYQPNRVEWNYSPQPPCAIVKDAHSTHTSPIPVQYIPHILCQA